MDDVFRALADPTRRSLLDELFRQDGQTLSALEQRLPMTRFGGMKHLRLVQSFNALWSEEVKSEGTSRVTWEIEPIRDSCRLTVTHDQLREGANDQLYGGWPMILSGLKTLLETGQTLTTPGSLMYAPEQQAVV